MRRAFSCLLILNILALGMLGQDSVHFTFSDPDFAIPGIQENKQVAKIRRSEGQIQVDLFNKEGKKLVTLSMDPTKPNEKSGPATGYYPRGTVQFRSTFINNKLHGPWMSWYANGQICDSGGLFRNLPDGCWKSWYPDGTLRVIAWFDAREFFELDQQMQRIAKRNFHSPITAASFADGDLQFNRYRYEEMRKAIYPTDILGPSPLISILSRLDFNNANGQDGYIPPFSQAMMQGEYHSFYPDGTTKDSGSCASGLRVGIWTENLQGGSIHSSGFYKKGMRIGNWRFADGSGKILYIDRYSRSGIFRERISMNRDE